MTLDTTLAVATTPSETPAFAQSQGGSIKWWIEQIDALDHEILRLALICDVHLLEPGVIERVLHNDDSVSNSFSPLGFEKLRLALMMNYALFDRAVVSIGSAEAALIVSRVERLAEVTAAFAETT